MYTGKWFSLISPLSEHALVLFYYDMLAAVLVFPRSNIFISAHTHTTEPDRNDAKLRPCPSTHSVVSHRTAH